MVKYIKNASYSFLTDRPIAKELRMKHVGIKNGKKKVTIFYAERTTHAFVIAIPMDIVDRSTLQQSERMLGGKVGKVKEGDFFMGHVKVSLLNVHQAHCNCAYVVVGHHTQTEIPIDRLHEMGIDTGGCWDNMSTFLIET